MPTSDRKFRVFLCHASQDKPIVRELYQRLLAEDWIDPWLDEEKLLPGQDWDLEIEKAVENADAVIVCLSNKSMKKEGYIQREFRFVLDLALEKPEGTIFIIPLFLEDCQLPRQLRSWQYVSYFPDAYKSSAYEKLLASLRLRNNSLLTEQTFAPEKKDRAFLKPEKVNKTKMSLKKLGQKKELDPILLRKAIHSAYDLPEFIILCNDLGIHYDDLRGLTFETKIMELIDWHVRRRKYADLVQKVLGDHSYLDEIFKK
jgi:hypothetical protein